MNIVWLIYSHICVEIYTTEQSEHLRDAATNHDPERAEMNIGAIFFGFLATAFTVGALLLPFAMRKWLDQASYLSPLKRLGAVLYTLFGTMGAAMAGVVCMAMACAYMNITGSTFWWTFLAQAGAISVNLFFWFLRPVRQPS